MSLLLSGSGDIIEPEDDIAAIGSGSGFAQAAGIALLETTDWPPSRIARRSIEIASRICIYTDDVVTVEAIGE